MKVLAILWLLMTTLVGDSMQCTLEQFEVEVPGLVRDKFTADRQVNVTITKIYYNCLSTTVGIGNYSSMSVSLIFNLSSDPNTEREIRYNMVCNNNGEWNRYNIIPTALRSNETRTDCYQCINTTINVDHCSPCDSSCTGLNQCYGAGADQCCSYNDDGNCVADCGMNREGNSTFYCVCSNFWTGDNCSNCNLNCQNEGMLLSDCSMCQCMVGYSGTTCENNIDDCDPNPCQHGGICMDGINDYNCTCVEGYSGTDCEISISDDCIPNPCQNRGACMDGVNSYSCVCTLGYTGDNCDENINDCISDPCQNGGTCTDKVNMYTCACVTGYTGTDCEIDIDKCDPNPCQHGGRCSNVNNDYNCTCDPVHSGHDCSSCAIPNCEQCKASDQSAVGECTKCAGAFVLDEGTCNDTGCGIPNCILCDKVDMICAQCQEGYGGDSGKCSKKDTSDGLSAGAIIGIIFACIAGSLILILIIVAIAVGFYQHKRKMITSGQSQEWNSNYQGQTEEAAFFLEDTSGAKGEEERLLDNENEDKEL